MYVYIEEKREIVSWKFSWPYYVWIRLSCKLMKLSSLIKPPKLLYCFVPLAYYARENWMNFENNLKTSQRRNVPINETFANIKVKFFYSGERKKFRSRWYGSESEMLWYIWKWFLTRFLWRRLESHFSTILGQKWILQKVWCHWITNVGRIIQVLSDSTNFMKNFE